MQFGLAYGEGRLTLEIPHPHVECVEPVFEPGLADEQAALIAALRAPIGCRPLRQLAGGRDRIGIVVCDVTRAMPSARVLPPLLAELAHIPDAQISIFVALGTHRA
ncbi:MAG TPA: lactate racemase domain-containing protein, partial [Limnochordia bacterium]|nr:lactate racemase domain-containing protein [Limnochordia bacterium]